MSEIATYTDRRPSAENQRNHYIDTVRAVALFGICVINIPIMGMTDFLYHTPPETAFDLSLKMIIESIFMMKFFLLFSFAFGWSVFIQHDSLLRNKINPKPIYFRRVIGLIIFGTLHVIFVFNGDILILYGLMAIVLWPLRNRRVKTLVSIAKWSALLSVFTLLLLIIIAGDQAYNATDLRLGGSFIQTVEYRIDTWSDTFSLLLLLQGPLVFSAFVLGLAAAKSDFFDRNSSGIKKLAKRTPLYLTFGLLTSIFFAWSTSYGQFDSSGSLIVKGLVAALISAPLMTCVYLYFIVRFSHYIKLLNVIQIASRNTLSCYILQGILASFCFADYGFGWFNQLNYSSLILLAIGIYLISCLLVGSYAKHFGKGPLEPILRRVAYGK
ncbi:DUF418 domain-containing protein [Vibrio sonorensis]|uniref:DUF418 domain-containing protein n=1 Tax=Vibrio sonorensis TaxID=1004316 RepID=UPI0008DB0D41|nr:DUF418 domain-containing protein [Vibrio sonorensis]